jgi:hypothetical protein
MSYEPGDFRDVEVRAHRAGPIGDCHVPTVAIYLHSEWPTPSNDVTLEELARTFDGEAQQIAAALIGSLPGGVLDRLVGRLLAYKASHFIVNHDTAVNESATQ